MLYRKCAEGNDISIHFGNLLSPEIAAARKKTMTYIVWSDGAIVLETNSFKKAEAEYIKECNKVHSSSGRYTIGVNKIDGGIMSSV